MTFRGGAKQRISMFRVGDSIVCKVSGGQKIMKFLKEKSRGMKSAPLGRSFLDFCDVLMCFFCNSPPPG